MALAAVARAVRAGTAARRAGDGAGARRRARAPAGRARAPVRASASAPRRTERGRTTLPGGGEGASQTRLQGAIASAVANVKDRLVRRNALYSWMCIFSGFLLSAFIPHPQSPADCFIALGIVFLSEAINMVRCATMGHHVPLARALAAPPLTLSPHPPRARPLSQVLNAPNFVNRGVVKFLRKYTNIIVIVNNFRMGLILGLLNDGIKVGS